MSSAAAAATNQVVRAFDESGDYLYSGYNSTYRITLSRVSLRHLGRQSTAHLARRARFYPAQAEGEA